jgi:hypothetical protein
MLMPYTEVDTSMKLRFQRLPMRARVLHLEAQFPRQELLVPRPNLLPTLLPRPLSTAVFRR